MTGLNSSSPGPERAGARPRPPELRRPGADRVRRGTPSSGAERLGFEKRMLRAALEPKKKSAEGPRADARAARRRGENLDIFI